jgi:hypothetical protein
VNPELPLAVAMMVPLEAPAAGLVVVPFTVIVTPAHGSFGEVFFEQAAARNMQTDNQ